MKIQTSHMSMESTHDMKKWAKKEESLNFWIGEQRSDSKERDDLSDMNLLASQDIFEISEQGQKANQSLSSSIKKTDSEECIEFSIRDEDKQKIMLLEKLLEKLTGKKFKFVLMDNIKLKRPKNDIEATASPNAENLMSNRQGWGLEYHYHETYYEKETLSFNTRGLIQTTDGRKISIDVQLNMSREFISQNDIRLLAGDAAIDPLVINYDIGLTELTDQKYAFDIDMDGSDDQISFVGQGSGFLALDLNNDGIINDGSELFGPKTGDGFKELQAYDQDGNGWIDESDIIYEKLRIWTKDENGNNKLFALGEKGIGAIYLGNIDTAYQYKDAENKTLGTMRTSSIFLKEDGGAGTVHQIDMAI
ncbi:hypothetical protein [Petroclostridium sp. X23]|uniref:hypothetical protein n=1 Tax=Petroclostridium sp. X23 TaxID=3045146 RepID=UPI0024AD80B8|nr:hypothetical protein [Petroclostridium sp. X23]WHH59480.1 hypothetical protein QKW49_01550 [Petroclostridium sp. X23]